MRSRRHYGIDVARVDHEHGVLQVCWFTFIKKPEGAWQAARIEEFVTNGHHDVDVTGINELLANVFVFIARV